MLKTCVFVSIRYGRTIRHYECFYREGQAGFKCFLNKKQKNLNRVLSSEDLYRASTLHLHLF